MLNELIRKHKVIATTIFIVIVALIAYGLYIVVSRTGKEPVTIFMIPSDTTLTIGGEQHRSGTAYLKPGTYDISATREGFETHEDTITINQPNNTEIDISLFPVSDEAKQWVEENSDLYKDFQVRTGVQANEFGAEMGERFPITNHLPTGNFIYTIGNSLKNPDNPTEGIVLEIDAITGYREAALDRIRELGFDPTDYEIKFNNYENPFES